MNLPLLLRKFFIITGLIAFSFVHSETPQMLPLDQKVRTGILDNGLKYFIKHNSQEKGKASTRLILRVGSVNEAENEQGLAHFVQLMNFRGTSHFPSGTITSFLDSIGAKVKKEENSETCYEVSLHTYYDKTTYRINIPMDDPDNMRKVLTLYGDWVGGRSLMTPPEVEEERGILLQKWLFSRDSRRRYHNHRWEVMLEDTAYANRPPYGSEDVIRNCTYQDVRTFYHRWYQPNTAAVVVIGDVDVDQVEQQIINEFSSIPSPTGFIQEPSLEVPEYKSPRFAIVQDPEATTSEISISFNRKRKVVDSIERLHEKVEAELLKLMFNARMREMPNGDLSPFLRVEALAYSQIQSMDFFEIDAQVLEESVLDALESLLVEVKRVKEHGFTSREFQRARADYMALLERDELSFTYRNSHLEGKYFLNSFMDDLPIFDSLKVIELSKDYLRTVNLDDIHERAKKVMDENTSVISILAPEQGKLGALKKNDLQQVICYVQDTTVEKWYDSLPEGQLFPYIAKPGKIVSTHCFEKTNIKEYCLDNGMRVFFKPTKEKSGKVIISAIADGGYANLPEEKLGTGMLMSSLAKEGGIGGFNKTEIEKLLKGKKVSFETFFNINSREIHLSTNPKDLDTAMQLIHLVFTEKVNLSDAYPLVTKLKKGEIENRENNPLTAFIEKTTALNTNNHPLFAPLTMEALDSVSIKDAQDFYEESFGNPAEFVLFVVGDIESESLEQLIEMYVANITKRNNGLGPHREIDINLVTGVKKEEIYRGLEQGSKVQLSFPLSLSNRSEDVFDIKVMSSILEHRLIKVFRDKLSASWYVDVDYNFPFLPSTDFGFITISFDCAPKDADRLVFMTFKEINLLQKEGPLEEDIHFVQKRIEDGSHSLVDDEHQMISVMLSQYQYFKDVASIWSQSQGAERLNDSRVSKIKEVMKEFLASDNYTLVILHPEKVES